MKRIPVCTIRLCLDLQFSSVLGHPLIPDFFLDLETDMIGRKQEGYGKESTVCKSP